WRDDGSEIDSVFNIDLTAVGTHTVTVTSNGVSGLGFQTGGNPPSQSRGNGQMVVTPRPTVTLKAVSWNVDAGGAQYVLYKQNTDWTTDKLADEGSTQVTNPMWENTNG